MSFIHELRAQKPIIRHAVFVLALIVACAVVGYIGMVTIHRELYAAFHTPAEQQALAQRQDELVPNPIAVIARAAGTLTASLGSIFGFNSDAGFDRGGESGNNQGGAHLLPVSQ
jgi:hypothetical protein